MLGKILKECGAIKFGRFRLTSGKESSFYIDIKEGSTKPEILREIAREIAKHVAGKYDRIAGMELGAVSLVVATALETNLPYVIVRKVAREHGTGKQIEGTINKGDNVIVVEDVATTGSSILKSVIAVRDGGGIVKEAIAVVDREEGARQLLKDNGIELLSLVKISELMR